MHANNIVDDLYFQKIHTENLAREVMNDVTSYIANSKAKTS